MLTRGQFVFQRGSMVTASQTFADRAPSTPNLGTRRLPKADVPVNRNEA